jgi:hypothetical protein
MRKVFLVTFVALFLAGLSAPAFAEDDNDNGWTPYTNSNQPGPAPKLPKPHHADDPDSDARHNHLKDQYEDVTGVIIPPVAIKPGTGHTSNVYELPQVPANTDQAEDNSNNGIPDATSDALNGINDSKNDYSVSKLGSNPNQPIQATINSKKSAPVHIKSLVLTTRTPTDEFMTGAMVLGASLAVVAFGLLAMTSIHHLKFRRKALTLKD